MARKKKIVEKVIAFEGEQDFILNSKKPEFIGAGEVLYVEAAGGSITQTLTGTPEPLTQSATSSPTRTEVTATPTGTTTRTTTDVAVPTGTQTTTQTATATTSPTRTEVAIPTKPTEPRIVTEVPVPTKPTEPRVVTEITMCFFAIDQFNLDVSGNQAAVNVTVKAGTKVVLPSNGKVAYSLDGSAPVVTDPSFVLKNLSSGSHTLTVSAVCDDGNGGIAISSSTQTKTFTIKPSETTVTTTTTFVPPFRGGFGGGGGAAQEEEAPAPEKKKKSFPLLLVLLIAGGVYMFAKRKKD